MTRFDLETSTSASPSPSPSNNRKRQADGKLKNPRNVAVDKLKKPTNAYGFYMKEQFAAGRVANPNVQYDAKTITSMRNSWKTLSEEEREKYTKLYQESTTSYKEEKKTMKINHTLNTRLSLVKVVAIHKQLTSEQEQAVRDIGFGGLLQLQCTSLKKQLCKWLIDQFDPSTQILKLHGEEKKITANDVEKIFGLSSHGVDVPTYGSEEDFGEFINDLRCGDTHIPIEILRERLQECKTAGHEFKVLYSLCIMGYFMNPQTDSYVKSDMVHAVKNVDEISTYNWSKENVGMPVVASS